jgi:hypothetical protein
MFAKKTARIRHAIIRLIAPKIYAQTVPKKTRPFTNFVKNKFNNKSLMGAEIGVSKGFNALNILQNLNVKKLFLIDPYESYISTNNRLFSKVEVNKHLDHAKRIIAKYKDVVRFILLRSSEAVTRIPDDLDFIYIDGCHRYVAVKEDIEKYWQKVRKGGVVGGHDFINSNLGVIKAVMEFVTNQNLNLQVSFDDWWIVKP